MLSSLNHDTHLSVDLIINFGTAGSVCLRFAYHMYGVNVGSLEVVNENVTLFHEAGNKRDQWRNAAITLTNTDYTMDQKVFIICIMTRTMYIYF